MGLYTLTHERLLSHEFITETVNVAFHPDVIVCELGVMLILINGLKAVIIPDTIISLEALAEVGYARRRDQPEYAYQLTYVVVVNDATTKLLVQLYHVLAHFAKYQIVVLHAGIVGLAKTTHDKSTSHVFVITKKIVASETEDMVWVGGVCIICNAGLYEGVAVTIISLEAFAEVGYARRRDQPEYAYQLVYVVEVNDAITELRVQLYHVLAHFAKYQIVVLHAGIVGFTTTTHDKSTSHVFVITRNIDALSHDWRFIIGGVCIICNAGINEATFTEADQESFALLDINEIHQLYAYHDAYTVFTIGALIDVWLHEYHVEAHCAKNGILRVQFGDDDVITNQVRSESPVFTIVRLNVAVHHDNTVCTQGDRITSIPGVNTNHDCHAHHDA